MLIQCEDSNGAISLKLQCSALEIVNYFFHVLMGGAVRQSLGGVKVN